MSSLERYHWLKEHRICVQCGAKDAKPNNVKCWECIEKEWNYNYSDDKKLKNNNHVKNRYYRLKEQGLCTKCGKRDSKGKTLCVFCMAKTKKRVQERYREKYGLKSETGKCLRCNKMPLEGQKYCNEHLDKQRAICKYARGFVDFKNHPFRKINSWIFTKGVNYNAYYGYGKKKR